MRPFSLTSDSWSVTLNGIQTRTKPYSDLHKMQRVDEWRGKWWNNHQQWCKIMHPVGVWKDTSFFKKRWDSEMGPLMRFQKAYGHQWAKRAWQSTLWIFGHSSAFQANLATGNFLDSCFSYLCPQFFFVSCQLNFYVNAISTLQKQILLRGFHFHWQIICKNVDCHSLSLSWKWKCNQA